MGTVSFLLAAVTGLIAAIGVSRILRRARRPARFNGPARLGMSGGAASDDTEEIATSVSTLVALSVIAQGDDCPPVAGGKSFSGAESASHEGETSSSSPASNDGGSFSSCEDAGSATHDGGASSDSSYDGGGSSYDGGGSSSYDSGSASSYDSGGTSSY